MTILICFQFASQGVSQTCTLRHSELSNEIFFLLCNEPFISGQLQCHMLIFIEMKQPSDDNKLLKGIFCGKIFNILH